MMKLFNALVLVAALGAASASQAASLRCNDSEVVSDGATKSDVLLKCGEPSFKDSRSEPAQNSARGRVHDRIVYRTIEEWTYNFGPGRLIQTIIFVDGKLVDVKAGGYGR